MPQCLVRAGLGYDKRPKISMVLRDDIEFTIQNMDRNGMHAAELEARLLRELGGKHDTAAGPPPAPRVEALAPAEPATIDPSMDLSQEQMDEVQQLWGRLHEQGQRVVHELLGDYGLMVPHPKMPGAIRIDAGSLTVVEYSLLRHIMLNELGEQENARSEWSTTPESAKKCRILNGHPSGDSLR